MTLEIHYKEDAIDRNFVTWLTDIIRDQVKFSINGLKLIVWDEYLNKEGTLDFTTRKSITAKELIEQGADNFIIKDVPNKFIIQINNNINVNGLKSTKLETLCRLINFGNTSIKGYPIFTDTFHNVEEHIDDYVEIYYKTIE